MWIRNTSRRPDDEVSECVEFAVRDVDMRRVCVNVKNGALGGAAYNGVPEISNAPRGARYLVTLRLGRGGERWPLGPVNYHFKGPGETGPRNRFPFFVCRDWREWLVKLAAHEAHHIAQFRAKGSCSELACERVAVERLHAWRALQARGTGAGEQLVFPGIGSDPALTLRSNAESPFSRRDWAA